MLAFLLFFVIRNNKFLLFVFFNNYRAYLLLGFLLVCIRLDVLVSNSDKVLINEFLVGQNP